jgi:hypothetical protein
MVESESATFRKLEANLASHSKRQYNIIYHQPS